MNEANEANEGANDHMKNATTDANANQMNAMHISKNKPARPLVSVRLRAKGKRRWTLRVLPFLFACNAAFAQQSAVQTSVNRAVDFGTRILFAIGAFLILGGIAGAAWSINNADPDGKRKAFFAIGGGLLFAMARPIVEALFEIGGGP